MGQTDDPEILEVKNKILTDNQRREQAAWEAVMNTESGRRVMWDLMQKFGLYDYCLPANGNGTKLAENAARQGCAQFIRNRIAFYCGGNVWAIMEREDMTRQEMDDNTEKRETSKIETERGKKP